MDNRNVPVTVVLPTLNEVDGIGDAIAALGQQTHPVDKVFLLDGGSTDGTVRRAEDVASAYDLALDVTEQKDGNIGWACHTGGMKAATYIMDDLGLPDGVIVRTDGDSALASNFTATAISELADPDTAIMGATTVPKFDDKWCGCAYHAEENLTRSVFALASNMNRNPKGRAQAWRASDFKAVNGYCLCADDVCHCDPDWYEDAVVAEKLKTRGNSVFTTDTFVRTELPSTTLGSARLWFKHRNWRKKVAEMDWLREADSPTMERGWGEVPA